MPFFGTLALALVPLIVSPPHTVDIPDIGLQAPVVPAKRVELDNNTHTWTVPCDSSASSIATGGNITLFGHRDVCGGVFDDLPQLAAGSDVFYDGHHYVVSETTIVRPLEAWPIQDFEDERITLISCWPPGSTAQRYVVVALRAPDAPLPNVDPKVLGSVTGDSPTIGEAPGSDPGGVRMSEVDRSRQNLSGAWFGHRRAPFL